MGFQGIGEALQCLLAQLMPIHRRRTGITRPVQQGGAGGGCVEQAVQVCPQHLSVIAKAAVRALAVEMDRVLRGLDLPRDIVVMTPEEFEVDRQIPGTVARPASLQGRVLYDRAA